MIPRPASGESPRPASGAKLALGLSVALAAAAQLFLKAGAETFPESLSWRDGLPVLAALRSGWIWLGIAATVISLIAWLRALRSLPLNVAFNIAALSQVIVPVASWLIFDERISSLRILGISFVFAGVVVIAKPMVRAEEAV